MLYCLVVADMKPKARFLWGWAPTRCARPGKVMQFHIASRMPSQKAKQSQPIPQNRDSFGDQTLLWLWQLHPLWLTAVAAALR